MLEIAAINLSLPTFDYISYMEDRTFRDFDIVLFNPSFPYLDRIPFSSGGSCIAIEDGRELVAAIKHWHLEMSEALKAGKTVFLMAEKPKTDNVAISAESKRKGERTYSTTPVTTYQVVPASLNPRAATGKFVKANGGLLRGITEILRDIIEYQAIFSANFEKGSEICAKDGAAIGGVLKFGRAQGNLVVLPYFEFGAEFIERDDAGREVWTALAIQRAKAIQAQLIAVDKALRAGNVSAPPPDWVSVEKLPKIVMQMRQEAASLEASISEMQISLSDKIASITKVSEVQNLLFGNGQALEAAIEDCLKAMGFKVSSYRSGDVESLIQNYLA